MWLDICTGAGEGENAGGLWGEAGPQILGALLAFPSGHVSWAEGSGGGSTSWGLGLALPQGLLGDLGSLCGGEVPESQAWVAFSGLVISLWGPFFALPHGAQAGGSRWDGSGNPK